MITKLDMGPIIEKTKELCQTLLDQPPFKELTQLIDNFAANEQATMQYNQLVEKQRYLQQKQQNGLQLTQQEVEDFKREEAKLYENQYIRQFIYAQNQFEKVYSTVNKYVVKSIELNRLPTEQELKEKSSGCGCGGNCGCGGH